MFDARVFLKGFRVFVAMALKELIRHDNKIFHQHQSVHDNHHNNPINVIVIVASILARTIKTTIRRSYSS